MRDGSATVARLLEDATAHIGTTLGLDRREARLEARVLAAFAWDVAPAWLVAHDTDVVDGGPAAQFADLLARRLAGEPVAYLTGTREFFGRPFLVTPDVLIPRPDTELIVELALARMPPERPVDVLDLGTGSGCIAITLALERPLARIAAVDRSPTALTIARRNAENLDASVEFINSDWYETLGDRRFDLIVSNPPYIAPNDPHLVRGDVRFEPRSALTADHAGLADLRRLIVGARRHLRPHGALLLEHGHDQAAAVRGLLSAAGFDRPQSWRDLAGIERVSGGGVSE